MKAVARVVVVTLAALLVSLPSSAAPTAPASAGGPALAGESSQVKAAAERSIAGTGSARRPAPARSPGGGAPARGPARPGVRIPVELQPMLQRRLERMVDADLVQVKLLRDEAHGLLSTFVAESPRDTREMPEAMMRLGEIKWEIEREASSARFRAWEARPVDQRAPAPEPNYAPSRELFARVLKDYAGWPAFTDYDLALYVDGFLATEQGKQEEAVARFERILAEFPRSRFVPDAHMAKAESLFNARYDYQGALAEYEQVLKHKDSELYGLALFKSAWCHWRLGNSDEAARRFVSVFDVADAKGKQTSGAQRRQLDELQGEALKYLVEVFTEDEKNTAKDVYGFLVKVGGDRFAGKVVATLAETFYDQAHYERGIEAYELLLRLEPTSREAGRWVLLIAEGYATLEDYPKLRATYERALAGYAAGGSWTRTQADPKNVAETQSKIESQLRDHAVNLHAKAQKDRTSKAEYDGAAGLYAIYLSKFAAEPKAYSVHFHLAEIDFYHRGKNAEAGTHYLAAARAIPAAEAAHDPLKTMRHDAVYNAIAALERVRAAELEARKTKGAAEQRGQESESDKTLAEALDLYAQLYPTDPSLPELFFRQGKLYYDYGVYDPAVKIWGALLEKFPRSQYAQGAGELILDSFNKSKNYENIETWARRLKSAPSFQASQEQAKLDVLIVQAVFKQGEQKAQAGDHAGAGAAYLRAAKEFPHDQRAAQACVNAELEAQKAGDAATLREAARMVVGKDYKDKPESPLGAWTAATAFQAMGLFAEAAEMNEAILSSNDKAFPHYQKFEHTRDAGYNAVVLREALGEHDRAVANGNKFLAGFGTSAEADEVVFQMGRAHQNAGRSKEAADLYKRYLARSKNQDHRVQGFVLLAMAQMKSGDDRGADESLREAVAVARRAHRDLGAEGKYAAAHARYLEGERVLGRYEKIQIQGDVKQLSHRLKEKAELLKQASTIFLDTVSLGVAEWSTAALYQIGHTYESFAKALRDAPAPAGLSVADKDAYQQQIDGFVVPIEEKSLDAYENGWKKALELGIYNQWTARMRDALGRLNAELYPAFKEIGFEVRSQAPVPLPPLLDAPRRGPVTK